MSDVDRLANVLASGFGGLGVVIAATFAPDGPFLLAQVAGMVAPILAYLGTRSRTEPEAEVVEA